MHQRLLKDIIPHTKDEVLEECEIPGIREEIKNSSGGLGSTLEMILERRIPCETGMAVGHPEQESQSKGQMLFIQSTHL